MFNVAVSYSRISVVDDLSHKIGEEDSLRYDGEPGQKVAGTQTKQLRWHLQHGEPQQPNSGLNLTGQNTINKNNL